MKKRWLPLLLCSLIIAAGEPAIDLEAKLDLDRMQGVWMRVSTESGGNKRIHGKPRPLLIINENQLTFGGGPDSELAQLDPRQAPKAIDLTPTGESAGPLQGKTYPGIYKLEGDTLTLCLSIEPGSKRPTKFATAGNSWIIDVYERSKPEAP